MDCTGKRISCERSLIRVNSFGDKNITAKILHLYEMAIS